MSAPSAAMLAALAERALQACPGEAQATVSHERSLLSRFRRSTAVQTLELETLRVGVLCVRDGHCGTASTTRTDRDGLTAAGARALAAAEAAARSGSGDHPGLPATGVAPRAHAGFDPRSAQPTAAMAGRALEAVFAACAAAGSEASGIWSSSAAHLAIATSTGLRAADAVTAATMSVIATAPAGRSGFAAQTAVAAQDLDASALGADASQRANRSEAPGALEAGEYPAVIEADAVGELLDWLGRLAFDGLTHADGRGALSGRLGTRVAAAAINLADSPRDPLTLPRAVDADAIPKGPLPLIQDGVAHRVVHDLRSAARAGGGARSTGHSLMAGGDPDGPAPTNLVLSGGGARSIAELCAPIRRGIYVTRLAHVHPLDSRQTLLSGVTRDGTFLIEDGQITRPLADVRFTDSVLRLLDATEALGARARLVSPRELHGRNFAHGVVCPPLRAQGFRVTGSLAS